MEMQQLLSNQFTEISSLSFEEFILTPIASSVLKVSNSLFICSFLSLFFMPLANKFYFKGKSIKRHEETEIDEII